MRGSSSFKPQERMQAKLCAAKASFNSITSISFIVKSAFAKALFAASTGPMPIILGATPAAPIETIRANGFNEYFFNASSDANSNAAAPSFKPEALPAVTVPSFLNAGRSFDKTSVVVLGFINSSSANKIESPFFFGIDTADISFANRPRSLAAVAFC